MRQPGKLLIAWPASSSLRIASIVKCFVSTHAVRAGGGWFHQGEGRARGSVRWDGTLCSPWRVPPCVGRLEGYARLIGSGRVFRRFGWLSFVELEGLAKKIQGGCVDCSRAIRAGRGWRLAMVAGWSLGTSDFKVSFLSLTNDHSDGRR